MAKNAPQRQRQKRAPAPYTKYKKAPYQYSPTLMAYLERLTGRKQAQ